MAEQKKYYKYRTIGSVVKAKEAGQPDYIKINEDVVLKKGDFLNLESKKTIEDRLEKNKAKMKPESIENLQKYIDKFPSWVRFEIKQKIEE